MSELAAAAPDRYPTDEALQKDIDARCYRLFAQDLEPATLVLGKDLYFRLARHLMRLRKQWELCVREADGATVPVMPVQYQEPFNGTAMDIVMVEQPGFCEVVGLAREMWPRELPPYEPPPPAEETTS